MQYKPIFLVNIEGRGSQLSVDDEQLCNSLYAIHEHTIISYLAGMVNDGEQSE